MPNDNLKDLCDYLITTRQKYKLTVFFFFGIASVEELNSIKQQIPDKSLLFYFHPPKPEFDAFSKPAQLVATIPLSSESINSLILAMNCLRFKQVSTAISPKLPDSYQPVIVLINNAAQTVCQGIYHEKKSRLLNLRTSIQNLPCICQNYSANIPKLQPEVPAVICSAGPSLESQLELLKKHQENSYIICIGRVYNRLIQAGITPDYVVEIDPAAYINWSATQQHNSKSTLIAATTVPPLITKAFANTIWLRGESIYFNRLLKHWQMLLPKIKYSTTVTATAIDFAIQAGLKHICLIGNDFCLAADGSSHLSGGKQLNTIKDEVFEVPGIGKEPVKTINGLNIIRLGLEKYLAEQYDEFIKNNIQVINGTAFGAEIAFTITKPFEEFIKLYSATEKMQPKCPRYKAVNMAALPFSKIINSLKKHQQLLQQTYIANYNSVAEVLEIINSTNQAVTQPETQILLHCLDELTADIYLESSSYNSTQQEENRIKDINSCNEIKANLINDLIEDFQELLNLPKQPVADNHYQNLSFRKMAIAFVARSNAEYANLLISNKMKNSNNISFECIPPCGRFIPFTTAILPDGSRTNLNNSNQSMEKSAHQQLRAYLQQENVDINHTAIIFYAPADWLYPTILSEQYPGVDMMIIDPWPELFNKLINLTLFTHVLPKTATVVAIHQDLPNATSIVQQTLRQWQQKNRKLLLLKHPVAWQFPDIQQTYHHKIKSLINAYPSAG